MEDVNIMQNILHSLGGKRFQLFTGSKNFEPINNGIKMELVINKSNATHLFIIKHNKIYDLLFYEIALPRFIVATNTFIPAKNRLVSQELNVQECELETTFTKITGIYTKFC